MSAEPSAPAPSFGPQRSAHAPAAGNLRPDGEPSRFLGGHDRLLLARIEDAGLNASAPPQQRWMDGWLVRTCPGKAQRARCINAVAASRRALPEKLAECAALYHGLGLPLLVRITPFSEPAALDAELAARKFAHHDDTRVMVLPRLDRIAAMPLGEPLPGSTWAELAAPDYAEVVGQMRGSSAQARRAHAERLRNSPVPSRGFLLRGPNAEPLACGQIAQEGDLVGLYDVATAPDAQRRGYGSYVCRRLLTLSAREVGARIAYLQVGADNEVARRLYARLGFEDAYTYHYRLQP